jgi:hypothetical protein
MFALLVELSRWGIYGDIGGVDGRGTVVGMLDALGNFCWCGTAAVGSEELVACCLGDDNHVLLLFNAMLVCLSVRGVALIDQGIDGLVDIVLSALWLDERIYDL